MRLEHNRIAPAPGIGALNARYRAKAAPDVLAAALRNSTPGRMALVSSFGAESVVLLHMVAQIAPDLPVLFIDTEMLFAETLAYQREVAEALGLTNIRHVRAGRNDLALNDPDGTLHQRDPDACCALRKSAPLEAALAPFEGWITGRKRVQSGARASLEHFEAQGDGRLKVNPLAHWSMKEVRSYIEAQDLPRHPLVAKGYPSIGCRPCTSKVNEGEDPRAGRWRGSRKQECGIHFIGGKAVRGPMNEGMTWV